MSLPRYSPWLGSKGHAHHPPSGCAQQMPSSRADSMACDASDGTLDMLSQTTQRGAKSLSCANGLERPKQTAYQGGKPSSAGQFSRRFQPQERQCRAARATHGVFNTLQDSRTPIRQPSSQSRSPPAHRSGAGGEAIAQALGAPPPNASRRRKDGARANRPVRVTIRSRNVVERQRSSMACVEDAPLALAQRRDALRAKSVGHAGRSSSLPAATAMAG